MEKIKSFKFNTQEQRIFFISDLHYFHTNIIKYCNRPFASAEEMNESLINNWNSAIEKDDIVFDLGDFCWGGSGAWHSIMPRLNGHHILILGNHDRQNYRQGYEQYFDFVTMQLFIEVDKQGIYLNHIPFLTWDGCCNRNNTIWNLHGHVHLTKERDEQVFKSVGMDLEIMKKYSRPAQYDVGVDLNNFKPIPFEEIKRKIDFQIEHQVNETYWINHELD